MFPYFPIGMFSFFLLVCSPYILTYQRIQLVVYKVLAAEKSERQWPLLDGAPITCWIDALGICARVRGWGCLRDILNYALANLSLKGRLFGEVPSPVLGMNRCPEALAFTMTMVVGYMQEQEHSGSQCGPVTAYQSTQAFGLGTVIRET